MNYKCPECGSVRIRVEASCMFETWHDGEDRPDMCSADVSADGYANCVDCDHDGIVEGFEVSAS